MGWSLMAYDYQAERPKLFTDEGQRKFLEVKDRVNELLNKVGPVWVLAGNDGFLTACLDRMVELGEIEECPRPGGSWGQYRVFSTPDRHNR